MSYGWDIPDDAGIRRDARFVKHSSTDIGMPESFISHMCSLILCFLD